jgi:hypothetical protein
MVNHKNKYITEHVATTTTPITTIATTTATTTATTPRVDLRHGVAEPEAQHG